jgi:hypothetical protein
VFVEKFIQNGFKMGATSHPIVLDVWEYKHRNSIETNGSFYSVIVEFQKIFILFTAASHSLHKCWEFNFHSFMLARIGRPKLFTREEKALLSKKKPDLEVATSVSIPCLMNTD